MNRRPAIDDVAGAVVLAVLIITLIFLPELMS